MRNDWVKIPTVNDMPKSKTKKGKAISYAPKMEKPSYEQLIKEGNKNYEKRAAEKAFLMDGYNEKKLKSKNLIKKAAKIKAQQDKAKDKA